MSKIDNFPYPKTPLLLRLKLLESAEIEKVRLISREIIFAEFQPI